MRKTDFTYMGFPVVVDENLPDYVIRFAPTPIPDPNILGAISKISEEMARQTGISEVLLDLHRKSLHGQYAVRFTVEEGEMIASGPFPLWENTEI